MKVKIRYYKNGKARNVPWDDSLGDPVKIAQDAMKEWDIPLVVIYDDKGDEIARLPDDAESR